MPTAVMSSGSDPLAPCAFTKDNSAFAGWAKSSGGSVIYHNGDTINETGDVTLYAIWAPPPYCVIDLSTGASSASFSVTYLAEQPSGGFSADNTYKTTKLVLRRIEPGYFQMGGQYQTTLTKPYYIGIFEVTQKQYKQVMGNNPSVVRDYQIDTCPVDNVSYDKIRGSSSGSDWPSSSAVDSKSFMGRLRSRTGLDFDLPTEAQWEYACRAGTTTTYGYGNSANGNYMWYSANASGYTHDVGTKSPNSWGLYDMHGNLYEWCLDWYGAISGGQTDPKGPSSGTFRVIRGGECCSSASGCSSSSRTGLDPSTFIDKSETPIGWDEPNFGFRVVLPLSE